MVQLHCHSSLSFKDGLYQPARLVQRAKELGQPGLGLTEHGHLHSAPTFLTACTEAGIKGVAGMECYEAVPHTWDPDPQGPHVALFKGKWDPSKTRYHHLTLWVLNEEGWRNLCLLHTLSFTKGYKPKNQPLIDRANLERHNAGLLVGLGCPQSRTNVALAREGYQAAIQAAEWYFEVFGDRVYVEGQTGLPDQVKALADQRKLARHFGAKVVGTNDVHYLYREDGVLGGPHHMLVMARKFRSVDTASAESTDRSDDAFGDWYGSDQFYMKTREEMQQSGLFPQELDTTMEILDRVKFDFGSLPDPQPPQAAVPAPGEDPEFEEYLAALP